MLYLQNVTMINWVGSNYFVWSNSCNSPNRVLRPFQKTSLTSHVTLYSWAVLYTIMPRFKEGLDFPFLCSGRNLEVWCPSPPGTFHILIGKFSYFIIRFLNQIFFVINFSYFVIRFLLNSSLVKSDNEIGKVNEKKNLILKIW